MRVCLGSFLAFALWFQVAAIAADVSIDISSRETYVDLPVVLRIRIDDSGNQDPPEIPKVDGLKIESAGPPSRSSQISVINGRTAKNTTSVVYSYRVTPSRPGSFTIPPIQISAGGQKTITKAVRIVATKSETNDLLFVEITGAKESVYVGEAIELTLKIWIRPYKSKVYNLTLDEQNMWGLLSDQTSWGPFADRMQQLAEDRKRPGGDPVIRKDSEGNEREYLLYAIDSTIYPDRPGQIDGGDVRIVFNYPEALGRSRSPFSMIDDDPFFSGGRFGGLGSRLTVKKVRPVAADTVVTNIKIKPIPTAGRPADYRGAVGQYSITTEANPTVVQAGDPITLQIVVGGSGPMDMVRAPPLSETSELTNDFKVADDTLSGIVDGASKNFTTTIRPKQAGIEQVPAIGLTYFDPVREEFVTAMSKPVSIKVGEAEQLDLANIVGGAAGSRSEPGINKQPSERSDRLVADRMTDSPPGVLDSRPPAKLIDHTELAFLFVPPMICLFGLLFRIRNWLPNGMFIDRAFRRAIEQTDSVAEVGDAVKSYLMSKYRLAGDRDSAAQTVGALRGRGLSDLAIRVERLYDAAERSQSDHAETDSWRQEALAIVSELSSRRHHVISPATSLILMMAVTQSFLSPSLSANAPVLSPEQQSEIFTEAVQDYNNSQIASAGQKFEQLIESGVQNDTLFYNLGLAYERQGKTGLAIANYRRALRIAPEQSDYHQRLSALDSSQTIYLRRDVIRWCFLVAWPLLWITLLILIFRRRSWWTIIASVALVVCIGSGAVRLRDRYQFTRADTAVVVQQMIAIRSGDGDEFEVIAERDELEGCVVTVLGNRAGWSKVQLLDGTTGWVNSEALRPI
jgi:TolA-binding protein